MWRGHGPHGRGVSGELLGDKDKEDGEQRWESEETDTDHLDTIYCRVAGWGAGTDSHLPADGDGSDSLRHLVPDL